MKTEEPGCFINKSREFPDPSSPEEVMENRREGRNRAGLDTSKTFSVMDERWL
jgi:hypothetical protein